MSEFAGMDLPSGWKLTSLKYVTAHLDRGTAPNYVEESSVRVIGQAANQPTGIDWRRTRFHGWAGDSRDLKGRLRPDDVFVNSTGTGTLGRVGYFGDPPDSRTCIADGHLTVVRADPAKIHPRFLYYWLSARSFYDYMYAVLVVGATNQIELNRERLASAPVLAPPMDEQRRIVGFLDAQVKSLSRMAAIREAQRAALRERLGAALVDSFLSGGRGWVSTRLKFLFASTRNGVWGTEPAGDGEDVVCVRVADFQRNCWKADPSAATVRGVDPSEFMSRRLCRGDVLLEKSGGGDRTPVGFAVTFDSAAPSVCSNFVAALRVTNRVDPRFACLLLGALYQNGRNLPFIKQATGIQNLDASAYLAQEVLVPEKSIQWSLAREFDGNLAQVISVEDAIDRHLALITERCRAVITAAVTGEIDVTTAKGVAL